MRAIDIPTRIQVPFANSAGGSYKRTVPIASQIGIQDGAASYTDGFPPLNFVPVGAGGVPPYGQDMNGILYAVSAWLQWIAAGGSIVSYDSGWSTTNNGYPKGALLASTDATKFGKFWISSADNNTTDPDGGSPANWVQFPPDPPGSPGRSSVFLVPGTSNFTVPTGIFQIRARVWGGGGGGGGAAGNNFGTGGAGGGYAEGWFAVTPAAIIAVTVGAGGAAGATGGGNAGDGLTSSFGAFCHATGGGGGQGNQSGGTPFVPAGGSGVGGTYNFTGCNGGAPPIVWAASMGGGFGGGTFCSAGGIAAGGQQGQAGSGPGAGGAAGVGSGPSAQPGAVGQPGLVALDW